MGLSKAAERGEEVQEVVSCMDSRKGRRLKKVKGCVGQVAE